MPDHPETTASDKVATTDSDCNQRRDLDAIEGGAGLAEADAWEHFDRTKTETFRAERLRSLAISSPRHRVLLEVLGERAKQDRKWGEQNHGSVHLGSQGMIASADRARKLCDQLAACGQIAWEDVAIEELAEAIEATSDLERRKELVQCAAVLVAWIECIDRRDRRAAKVEP